MITTDNLEFVEVCGVTSLDFISYIMKVESNNEVPLLLKTKKCYDR